MSQSQDVLNVVEMGQSVIGVCTIFGCFIKFEVDSGSKELWITGESFEAVKEWQLPLSITEKTKKDKMFNVILEFCQSKGIFWDEPDRYGNPSLQTFVIHYGTLMDIMKFLPVEAAVYPFNFHL